MRSGPGNGAQDGPLLDKIKDRITRDGPMSVADYMAICLGDPDQGYYVTRDPLGADGDFITAPEISQVFGELIGAWSAVVWRQMGSPSRFRLIELGPGRGTLMADALRAGRSAPGFLTAADIHLIETSPVLRKAQETTLGSYSDKISWHNTLGEVPEGAAILIANEFLDALPVRQFVLTGGQWRERCIVLGDDGQLAFGDIASADAGMIPEKVGTSAPGGSIAEVCPAFKDLVTTLANRSAETGLAALFIDYGHTQSAPGDTFQAVRGHERFDPLNAPGTADLTAHVDFERLARLATDAGLTAHGPVDQGLFLMALGLKERTEQLLAGADERQARQLAAGARRLADAKQMGDLFKVMTLTRPGLTPPPFDATE